MCLKEMGTTKHPKIREDDYTMLNPFADSTCGLISLVLAVP